jgi:HK97 family phage portal protein
MSRTAEELSAKIIEYEAAERRSASAHPSSEAAFIAMLYGGLRDVPVDVYEALTSPAMASGIIGLTETLAMLPGHVYRTSGKNRDEKERVFDHPVEQLFKRQWNSLQSAYDGKIVFFSNLVARKGAYAEIIRDRGQRVREFWNVRADAVEVKHKARELKFSWTNEDGEHVTRDHTQMLYVNNFHLEGFVGLDPIKRHERTISASLALERYFEGFFKSGGNLRMALRYPQRIGPDAHERLRNSWKEMYGSDPNSVAIIENGGEAVTIGIAPDKAQMTAARISQVQDSARALNIPPSRIHENSDSTLTNVEQQAIKYASNSVSPKVVNTESAVNMQCFTQREKDAGFFFEFSLEGLLRADTLSRYTAYGMGINNGWLDRNEVRRLENLNPREGLSEPLVPKNMGTAASALQDAIDEAVKAALKNA